MQKKTFAVSVLMAALLGASTLAVAQPRPDDQGPGHGPAQQDKRGGPDKGPQGHGPQGHGPQQADRGGPPVPHRDWKRGERLPQDYRGNNYVVDDWRGHGLKQPPRGYHWVGVNGDYVLVAIATGVISSILLAPGH